MLTLHGPEDLAAIEEVPLADRDIAFTTYDIVRRAAASSPDATAAVWIPDPSSYAEAKSWTFAELSAAVHRIGNTLVGLGVGRQDAVTLVSPNTSALFATILAAEAVGIAAPVNPVFDVERIGELMRTTGSRVIVAAGPEIDQGLWERLLDAAATLELTALLALRPDGATAAAPKLGERDGVTIAYLETLAATADPDSLTVPPPRPDDVASFFHTGGTTGAPKVAAHTHSNEATTAWALALAGEFRPGATIIAGLPLFHVNALMVTGLAPLVSRSRSVWPGPAGVQGSGVVRLLLEARRTLQRLTPCRRCRPCTAHWPRSRSMQESTASGWRSSAPRHCHVPYAKRSSRVPASISAKDTDSPRRRVPAVSCLLAPAQPSPWGNGSRTSASRPSTSTPMADGATFPAGQVGELVISGPAVFAGYVHQTPAGRDSQQGWRRRRLAANRRPGFDR